MSLDATSSAASVAHALKTSIEASLPGALAEVVCGSSGHYSLVVTSPLFEGKGLLESQRLVYSAIAPLMKGDMAPVHAIDSLKTRSA